MYRLILVLLSANFLITFSSQGQATIKFSDQDFKQYFINHGYDSNNDGEIDQNEALAVDSIYIHYVDGVSIVDSLNNFKNLHSLTIASSANLQKLDLNRVPKLSLIHCDAGIVDLKLIDLPFLDSLSAIKTDLLIGVHLEDLPLLKKTSVNFLYARDIHIKDCSLFYGYKLPGGVSNLYLKNVGPPSNGLISLSPSFGTIPDSNKITIDNVSELNKLSIGILNNVDFTLINNQNLSEIKIDGKASFDSLDLRTNSNLKTFNWLHSNSSSVSGAKVGADYLNISGLKNLETFYKTSDYSVTTFKMDTLPSATYFAVSWSYIKELNSAVLPKIKHIELDGSIDNVNFDSSDDIISIKSIFGGNSDFNPKIFKLSNCSNFKNLNLGSEFRPDSLILINLPNIDDWELYQHISPDQKKGLNDLTFLHLEKLPLFYRLSNFSGNNMKEIRLVDLEIRETDISFEAQELVTATINKTNFTTISLCNSDKLTSCNVLNNLNLSCVCVSDIAYALNKFSKGTNTSWSEFTCDGSNKVEDSDFSELMIYPNPARDRITIENEQIKEVQIRNASSTIVKQVFKQNIIDISNLVPGTYFVFVINETGEKHSILIIN